MTAPIADNLTQVRASIAAACNACGRDPGEVQLLAVSKRHSVAAIRAAVAAGQTEFGENRVQELLTKDGELSAAEPVQWHLIGSLQTNKVRDLLGVRRLALVHSLDRERLATALQTELARSERELDVLLQVNATGEVSKHGCPVADAPALLQHVLQHCSFCRVRGVMAMGPLHGDPRPVFDRVAALIEQLRTESSLPLPVLSLGMSGDLDAAVAAGSTLVRIGTAVFGARD